MNQTNYFIKERQDDYGVVHYVFTPKVSKCEFCNVEHSTKKMDTLFYRDKDGYRRDKHLCFYCYKELKKLI
mgnify:FL=1